MGSVTEKAQQDEAMDLALLLYEIYNETQVDHVSEKGQIDAINGKDNN